MKLFNPTLLLISIIWLLPPQVDALEAPFEAQAQTVLAEWFSIDPKHDIQMQKNELPADQLGQRFTLSFVSDDQQKVNGTLAMPAEPDENLKLAVLLHPMGRDENIWWSADNPIQGGAITQHLRQQGFVILTLDARRHGQRKLGDMGLKEMLNRAHSKHRRMYDDMIIGTVRDYRLALHWLRQNHNLQSSVAAIGYSMGAQMSLLLARFEHNINQVISMVPPYVDQPASPVAPRHHVTGIKNARVLLMTADQDPYASQPQNQQVFELIASSDKNQISFDSGHLLPPEFLQHALTFIDGISGDQ